MQWHAPPHCGIWSPGFACWRRAGTAIAGRVLFAMWNAARRPATPRLSGFAKTLAAGITAAAGLWLMNRVAVHWMLALAFGGALYVGLLALTGAMPREFIDTLRRRPRSARAIQPNDV
jgi:hypothetical protein